MSNKKHIDRVFQEKFKDFEAKPDPNVWKNIEKQLQNSSTQKPLVIPFWQKTLGVTAVLLIALIGSFAVFNFNTSSNKPSFVDVSNHNNEEKSAKELVVKPNVISKKQSPSNKLDQTNLKNQQNNSLTSDKTQLSNESDHEVLVTNTKSENKKTNNIVKSLSEQKNESFSTRVTSKPTVSKSQNKSDKISELKTRINSDKTNTAVNSQSNNTNLLVVNNASNITNDLNPKDPKSSKLNTEANNTKEYLNPKSSNLLVFQKPVISLNDSLVYGTIVIRDAKSIEAAIEESKKNFEKELIGNRWTMSPNIAPVYYNSMGKGSQFGSQFINNNISGETNTSYGLKVGYAISDKVSIRSGIGKLNLSYDTDDVIIFENLSNNQSNQTIDNINFNNSSNLMVSNSNNLSVLQINGNRNYNAALSQRIDYIEIPMELEYKLNNNRFGIHIIGGFSTFILEDNQVVSEFDNNRDNIGEATNINNVSFSTNIGIGLNYKFSKSFIYNLEPTFKYQINGFSNTTGNFNPYIIGVYTGFSYKF